MLKYSIKLFSFIGVPVYAHWSLLLAFAVLAYMLGGLGLFIAAVSTVSVIIHEFAHIYAAKRFGFQTKSVMMHYFGGVATIYMPDITPKQEGVVSAAGPLASLILFAIAGVGAYAAGISNDSVGILAIALAVSAIVNGFIAIINMLPIYPLDGGRIFGAILEGLLGISKQKSKSVTLYVGLACSIGLIVVSSFFIKALIVLAVLLVVNSTLLLYSYLKTGDAPADV